MPHQHRLPTVRKPDEGLRVASAGSVYRYLAIGDETNGQYALFDNVLHPGDGAPLHAHSREEEAFYILEGEIVFYTQTQRIPASKGTFINMPTGVARGFRNETEQDARMLIIESPAGLENMFLEDGETIADSIDTASNLEQIACPKIAAEYGIENLSQPLPDM
ncbi:MAG: cupin domain-containing protein [Cyanobacteria bacterium P01_A01_bin.37]